MPIELQDWRDHLLNRFGNLNSVLSVFLWLWFPHGVLKCKLLQDTICMLLVIIDIRASIASVWPKVGGQGHSGEYDDGNWQEKMERRGKSIENCSEVKVAQLCPTLCEPMDYTVHGILQARILEWVAFSFSRGSSQPRDRTQVSCIVGRFFTSWATREALFSVVDGINRSWWLTGCGGLWN